MQGTGFSFTKMLKGAADLELILLPGVSLALDVLLQFHIIFEWLSGGREGNRGQKLNHQTTKHTHGRREGRKGKEGGERRTQFQVLSGFMTINDYLLAW